jgi:hypothetical protein
MTAAVALALAILGVNAAAAGHESSSSAAYGPFGVVGRVSVQTDSPRAPLRHLVNSGLAETQDGAWLRWRAVWRGRQVVAIDRMERLTREQAVGSAWRPRPALSLPAPPAGDTGCRLIGTAVTVRGRLGAWNCQSADGTLLGGLGPDGQVVVQARVDRRYQAMTVEATPHTGASRVILASYDPRTRRFDWLELSLAR